MKMISGPSQHADGAGIQAPELRPEGLCSGGYGCRSHLTSVPCHWAECCKVLPCSLPLCQAASNAEPWKQVNSVHFLLTRPLELAAANLRPTLTCTPRFKTAGSWLVGLVWSPPTIFCTGINASFAAHDEHSGLRVMPGNSSEVGQEDGALD